MKRSTLGLAGVLIALIVVAYLVMLKPGETSVRVSEGERLVQIDSAAVSKIEIASSNGEVTLEKRGSGWEVVSPIEDKADESAVGTALERASGMIVKGIVSTKPEKHSLFQVDSAGTRVTLYQGGDDGTTIIVGKASNSFGETYVRMEGSDEVTLVDGSLSWAFSKPLKDWRDRSVVAVPKTGIISVTFAYGDTTFTLLHQDSLWTVDGVPANQTSVNSFLTSLSSLQCDDFLTAPPSQRVMAAITVAGTTLSFRYDSAEKKYYASRSDDDRWLVISEWRANQVLKRKRDLL